MQCYTFLIHELSKCFLFDKENFIPKKCWKDRIENKCIGILCHSQSQVGRSIGKWRNNKGRNKNNHQRPEFFSINLESLHSVATKMRVRWRRHEVCVRGCTISMGREQCKWLNHRMNSSNKPSWALNESVSVFGAVFFIANVPICMFPRACPRQIFQPTTKLQVLMRKFDRHYILFSIVFLLHSHFLIFHCRHHVFFVRAST